MPRTITSLPTGTVHPDAVVAVDNNTGTATEKLSLSAIVQGVSHTHSVSEVTGAASLPTTGLTITKTGDWVPSQGLHPSLFFVPAQALQFENTYIRYSGKWVSQFVYAEILPTGATGRMTSLTFDDLEGTTGQFSVTNMTALTALSAPNLVFVGSSLVIGITAASGTGMNALTTLSLPALRWVGGAINAALVNSLTTLSLPSLSYVAGEFGVGRGGGFPVGMTSLTTLSVPALSYVGANFSPANLPALTTLSIPALSFVGGFVNPNGLNALTTLSLPALSFVGGSVAPQSMTALTTLSLPSLSFVGGSFSPNTMTALTTLSLPALSFVGGSVAPSGVNALANVTLPTNGTLKSIGGDVTMTGMALTVASVDNILQALASLDGTNGTTSYGTGRSVSITGGTNAAPSNLGSTTTAGSQFVCAGTTCTVNWTNHGYTTGTVLRISGITTATNANRYAVITVVNANQFTYTITSQTATGAGTATVIRAGASASALVTRGVTLTTN